MTQIPQWTDKDEHGNYLSSLMEHEVNDHGCTEQEAVSILTRYFGPVPPNYDIKVR